ncbi:MAG TPA: hypothetical protein VFY40_11780, partial [Blastocatellia bacterium]|nr:hypothetical protein [Blastocatellia bacterium]
RSAGYSIIAVAPKQDGAIRARVSFVVKDGKPVAVTAWAENFMCGNHDLESGPSVCAHLKGRANDYIIKVVKGELGDPTLSFQLRREFDVISAVNLMSSRWSRIICGMILKGLGYAGIVEWLNKNVAKTKDYAGRDTRFIA